MRTFSQLITLIIAMVFLPLMLRAQQDEPMGSANNTLFPAVIIKLSPLAFIEMPQPSLQMAIEYPVSPALSLQHELGWMPPMNSAGFVRERHQVPGIQSKE
jgi:hypothetical protein